MSGNYGDEKQCIIGDYGDDRGDISVYDGRSGFRYQETSHSSSRNCGESVDGDFRCGYRYQGIHSSYHNLGDHSRLFFLLVQPPRSQSLLIMGWCSSIPEHRLRIPLDSGPIFSL